ncbi:MAG TPA: ribosome assembly cofactor RimP [Candidatus Cloacimonetes bacterium]|nr:ribosome assembly cofactor RimP [Candidatus Cloacimonadota bacterium]
MLEKIEKIAKEACLQNDVDLYDVEIKNTTKGKIILVSLTKINGVSITECRNVSRMISNVLDMEDIIPGKFFLEVSSPGLERELKLKKHYLSAINEKIKLTFKMEDKIMTEIGILREVLPDLINVEIEDKIVSVFFRDIKKAKTYFDFKK